MKKLNENVSRNIMKTLKESENLEFFKTDGLNIACNVCIDNGDTNTNCKEVATEVVKAALDRGIDCKVVEPFVIVRGETASNSHYAIQVGDKIVDYTIMQFLGDNKRIEYFELLSNGDVYAMSATSLKGIKDDELVGANLEQLYKLSDTLDAILELL